MALGRLLSLVERGGRARRAVAALAYRAPAPYTVGLTGAPGAGKSTLTDRLIAAARGGLARRRRRHRRAADQVAVLGVDPSSPVQRRCDPGRPGPHAGPRHRPGRLHPLHGHPWTPGRAGPRGARRRSRALGAAGMPLVLLETVGVGQMEVEVASAADTTVVVVTPGWGDAMQANKAGLLEVADCS